MWSFPWQAGQVAIAFVIVITSSIILAYDFRIVNIELKIIKFYFKANMFIIYYFFTAL